jgi:hypothetical protein
MSVGSFEILSYIMFKQFLVNKSTNIYKTNHPSHLDSLNTKKTSWLNDINVCNCEVERAYTY